MKKSKDQERLEQLCELLRSGRISIFEFNKALGFQVTGFIESGEMTPQPKQRKE